MICAIISYGDEVQAKYRNEAEEPLRIMKRKVFELVQALYTQGYDSFYTNCEYGIPLWAAEAVALLKQFNPIELHIIMPFEEQAVHWSEDVRDRYFALHEKADSVELACTKYQEDCYSLAAQRMIEQCDAVVICGKEECIPDIEEYSKEQGVNVMYCPIN